MNIKIILTSFFLAVLMIACSSGKEEKPNTFLVCGDSKVLLVDYEMSSYDQPAIVWEWDAHKAQDLPEVYREKRFNTIDDCKSVSEGKQLLVSSSSGGVVLLDLNEKKALFYATVPNAHSIEILPGNRLVAAASTSGSGNKIMLFDIDQNEKVLFEDSLYSAHGVVWHEGRESLFALGYDVLREYKMPNPDQLVLEKEWEIPGEGGHDLQLRQDGKQFFLTEHTGAWLFDLGTEEFGKIEGFPDSENIKSLGENESGQLIFTVPEESWWTHHVSFLEPDNKVAFPDMKVYKARWYK